MNNIQIPFIALDRHYDQYKFEYIKRVDQVLSTGNWQDEDTVIRFEERLAKSQRRKFAIACNNNTDALLLAIKALNLPEKSDIIVPAFGDISTAATILLAGHRPLFVDVQAVGSLHVDDIPDRLTDNTKAMISVDTFGIPINREMISKTAEIYNIPVIYNCAQSFGALWKNNPVGATGVMSCFSFGASEFLSSFTGGGAIVCDEELIDFFLRGLRQNSIYTKQPGYNSTMNAVTSSLLEFKLDHTHIWLLKRQDVARCYNSSFKNLPGIYPISLLYDMTEYYGCTSNHSEYVIQTEKRNELKMFLEQQGIETKIHYDIILPKYSMFGKQPNDFYVSEQLTKECLSLPIFPEMLPYEIQTVIDAVFRFSEKNF